MTTRQTKRRGVAPLLAAIGLVLPAACGGSGGGGSSDSAKPEPSIGSPPIGALDPSAAPTIPPNVEINGSVPVNSAPFTNTAAFISFTNPNKDVGCTIAPSATTATVYCQPAHFGYTVKEPGSCPQGPPWGSTVQLTTTAGWACTTDAVGGDKVLQYGGRIDTQDYNCVSRPDGITCINPHTDHGFRISPAFYTLF